MPAPTANPIQDIINTITGMSKDHLGGSSSVNEIVINIRDTTIPKELSVKMVDILFPFKKKR